MARPDRDPGLPVKLHPVGNGEFLPGPPTPRVREAIRRANEAADRNARRTGMSRRQFLLSACGTATTLAVLSACSDEERRASSNSTSGAGGTFSIPDEATTDPSAAETTLGGDPDAGDGAFILDVQGHLLEIDDGSSAPGFPQGSCGDDVDCYDTEHFLDLVLGQSQTSMVVLSAVPFGSGWLSPDVMARAIDIADRAGCTGRVLMQGEAHPARGDPGAALDAMADLADRFDIRAWKTYTHSAGAGWFFDDHDPGGAPVGEAFLARVEELGVPIVAVHKGLSDDDPFASPVDIGPAAASHPDLRFVVYHSGFERSHREGTYDAENPRGVDRLIRSVQDAGIEPGGNVYAELGSTWRSVMSDPDQAAHLLGKLLAHLGEDNVVWGTDSIWYGSPQDQIDAFRAFEITEEFQERFGYPALTPEVKAKIFGLTSAELYGLDPVADRCSLDRDALRAAQEEVAAPFATHGPTFA
jgi:predicted TIM-barrel fold metal-dependent hydrolase